MKTVHVCIGCGRRDTSHPSKLCGKCIAPSQNENAQERPERGRRQRIDHDEKENPSHWRCLPGPVEEEDA